MSHGRRHKRTVGLQMVTNKDVAEELPIFIAPPVQHKLHHICTQFAAHHAMDLTQVLSSQAVAVPQSRLCAQLIVSLPVGERSVVDLQGTHLTSA